MIKNFRIIIIVLSLLFFAIISTVFFYKKEIISTLVIFKYFKERNLAIESDKYLVDTALYDLKLSKISIKKILKNYNYSKINSPVGFLESYNNRIFFITNLGNFFEIENFENEAIKTIDTNFNLIVQTENFVKTMGVRGIYFDKLYDKIYVSYIYNDKINNCTGIALISGNFNNFKNITFKEVFKTKCINYKNLSDFNEMSSGGKIISLDSENLLLTIGDFWQKNISQDLSKEYGKILKINKNNFVSKIYSFGHRNPQGIIKVNENIYSTEHGPRGGDEINQIMENNNYGWPVVSYGPTYKKDYTKYFLDNHKNYKEPFLAFAPSIGISDIEFYNQNLLQRWKGDLLVASMKNNTGIINLLNPGLSIYRIKLNQNKDKVIYQEKIYIGDRVRDIEILDNGTIFFVTEENPALYKINKDK